MQQKLRIGVAGCGRMGCRRAKEVVLHPEADLVLVVDSDAARARNTAAELGGESSSDLSELARRSDIDCVFVSLPNNLHCEAVREVLSSGKHVFCEKPLAITPAEGAEMVRTAAAHGVTLTTGSNLRYFPNMLKAKELLASGIIGDLLFFRGWIGHAGWNLTESWFSDARSAGGGTFLDNGIHLLDLARYFMGEAVSCTGTVSTGLWPVAPLEDFGVGIFTMASGAVSTIQASWTEWNGYLYAEIYGSQGYLQLDSRGAHCRTVVGNRAREETVYDYSRLPPSSYAEEFSAYVRDLRAGTQPTPSGHDGLRAVQMACGVYESARTGRAVTLSDDFGVR